MINEFLDTYVLSLGPIWVAISLGTILSWIIVQLLNWIKSLFSRGKSRAINTQQDDLKNLKPSQSEVTRIAQSQTPAEENYRFLTQGEKNETW